MEKQEPRVGVYVCHCGSNIAGTVDVEKVAEFARTLPDVISVRHYAYMCSEPGQALIKEDIKKLNINRVVVASCSPRMHEPTYRKVLQEMDLNPFYFEMANIREHVSWAHMKEPDRATEKAKDLVKMAVARARLLEPVSKMEVKVTQRALVIGGGIAGITATLDLANRGFEVVLLEKKPFVGGHMALLNRLYWGGEASNILALMTKGLSNSRVKVLTDSEVAEHVEGYIGNFSVKIAQKPQYVNDNCNLCGKCAEACPVTVPNNLNSGLDQRKAIYLPARDCYPARYVLDRDSCEGRGIETSRQWGQCSQQCLKACERNAITLGATSNESVVEVGTIIVTTGFELYNPEGEFGYGESKDVITQLTLERILNAAGPYKGKLVKPSDGKTPNTVVFILCVGSRQEAKIDSPNEKPSNPYCSRFCCSSALKNVMLIKEKSPETEVYVLYRDIRTFGREHENLYRKAREVGVNFIRFKREDPPKVVKEEDGRLHVDVKDWLFKVKMEIASDLIVLVEGMVPAKDVIDMNAKLSITRSPDGFFQEAHPKMNPLDTFSDGIFVGGTAQGPKDIIDTVSQASGAAAKAAAPLSRGKVLIDLVTASVNKDLCVGCSKCVDICPYKAITLDETEDVVNITDVKCKGCGSCAATCPVGAMELRHFKDAQFLAMVEGFAPEEGQ
jgi:heterodisulfide reductase subunit A